jgi:hypothetical protein
LRLRGTQRGRPCRRCHCQDQCVPPHRQLSL